MSSFVVSNTAIAQQTLPRGGAAKQGGKSDNGGGQKAFIKPNIRVWRMVDDYTLADTIAVDTLTNLHQINNRIWLRNVANTTLGNLGSPSVSAFYPTIKKNDGNIFYNSLAEYIEYPNDFIFYDTKTPYTNLTYQMGYPKRRSEEYVHVIFTQNVTPDWNIGMKFGLSTSIGRYQAQRADHTLFRLWSSYDGEYYSHNLTLQYSRHEIRENGGILDDNYILYPDSFDYDKADDLPVQFMNMYNERSIYQLHYAQRLNIGFVERESADSVDYDVPVATAFHTLHVDKSHHEFKVASLSDYYSLDNFEELFPYVLRDPNETYDEEKYLLVSNMFQLKMNEEFNSLLRFGLRAYLCNEIRQYRWGAESDTVYNAEIDAYELEKHRNKENRVTTYVGGQIFKNIGEAIRWNAGAKLYLQGYRTGDFDLSGHISSAFPIGKIKTEIFADANLKMTSPELFEEKYCSNNYRWDVSLSRTKTLDYSGGIRIPTIKLEARVFGATINDRIYFNEKSLPSQKDGVLQVFGAYLYKHSAIIGFNNITRLTVQSTSDNEVLALPSFALFSTNFYERLLFGVLTFQVGFDVRYNTKYYAPAYTPGIMQFHTQKIREVGGYGYFDPFINIQLKRCRGYLKYEHVNYLWGSRDYFNTVNYPANPATIKFGISWNFYD
ncbi:MAG: putative porin [Bacteroidales bacterium]|nr:putative porin [Bacteroidales bacterium]